MTDSLLCVEHLTMRFGGLSAINDLSFHAKKNQITAIIGPNGAGKTTVFNCLTGFYKPNVGKISLTSPSGRIFLLERMEGFRIAKEARLARTFQNIRLFTGMSVLENLMVAQHNLLMRASLYSLAGLFGSSSFRRAEQRALELARYWLNKIGLLDYADQPAGSLPYGSQRRLEIARAMCTDPVLLCLDEPAAGLNPKESYDLNGLLLDIRSEFQIGILLIEHDMSVVMNISDHVVVLDHGARIAEGSPTAVQADPAVIHAYLGTAPEEPTC
ncbi:MAG TPA: ATP-binding cassette domain-containing protein [Rhodospirillaceae bacterium]|nr:ATP-binding cassette domain-containing protein [Rhodospirillaceae bacterium]